MNCAYKKNLAVVAILASMLSLISFISGSVALVNGAEAVFLSESIVISVDCDTARLDLACTITSINSTLVHFPDPVNLNDTHLVDCTSVAAIFTMNESVLAFHFNSTDKTAAESNANAMIPSMNTAFSLTFTHYSTANVTVPEPYVIVIYKADAKADMPTFLAQLETDCFHTSVGGFSNTLSTLFTHAENESVVLTAMNFASMWDYAFVAQYDAPFPAGSDSHTVDVLYWLGTSTLQPSQYSWLGVYYLSYLQLTINSSATMNFVSCNPANITMPFMNAGWYVPVKSGNQISSGLYFGNSIPEWTVIDFTFDGIVVPEYSPITVALLLVFASATVLCMRKRLRAAT